MPHKTLTRLLYLSISREQSSAATNLAHFYTSPAEVQKFSTLPLHYHYMAPLHPPIFCTLLLYLTSSQISWLLTYGHLCTSRHGHGHGRNLIPSHVPARLRPTRTTGGLTSPARLRLITPTGSLHGPGPAVSCPRQGRPLYTNRPPSTGTALVMGPSPAQADSDPKTS